ncbi:phytanoyl-CoA dioxygenase family protein [Sneathiella limimaris]|uniref:phytanoyl-CoA dioxygenase family protein n=1 Tax=Sneathiella limimaris TaxID=1964213 RepID=UPI00146CBBBB|nr:phytanoyl-CoA dioxygenase family protein [Sneathiella limimaris]
MLNWSKDEWLHLCPELTIEGDVTPDHYCQWDGWELEEISTGFHKDGYLNLSSVLPSSLCEQLSDAMEILANNNIPAVYIYIYDQPWQLFESLRQLISHFLGEDYALLPNFWAWNLSAAGEAGWSPHRDCDAETVFDIGGDTLLMSLSLWVPLTEVDERNGCMFVIPRSEENNIQKLMELDRENLLPFAKPLPAKAGSVLGWPQDLYHFGGEYRDGAKTPRRSLSFEFQNTSFDPLAKPLLSTRQMPDFETRLRLMSEQFEKYRHIDPTVQKTRLFSESEVSLRHISAPPAD